MRLQKTIEAEGGHVAHLVENRRSTDESDLVYLNSEAIAQGDHEIVDFPDILDEEDSMDCDSEVQSSQDTLSQTSVYID